MAPSFTTYSYDERDHEIVDYQSWELPESPGVRLRGPEPTLVDGGYFTCVGAAQTMGVYVPQPFPELLSATLDLPVLNLGLGAAWPALYTEWHPELLERINRGRFLILQVMSARGGATSWYENADRVEHLRDRRSGEVVNSVLAWARVLQREPDAEPRYVEELRDTWIAANRELVARVTVPIILFWYSTRAQDQPHQASLEGNLFENMGAFPQFVDSRCVDAIRVLCAGYCECTSTRNLGHLLISRFTGEPVRVDHKALDGGRSDPARLREKDFNGLSNMRNEYYPSPEMHLDAAAALYDEVRRLGLA